jgi:hypothetical protein
MVGKISMKAEWRKTNSNNSKSAENSETQPFEVSIKAKTRHAIEQGGHNDKWERITKGQLLVFAKATEDLFSLTPHGVIIGNNA